jgi:8-oxo-dGTP pyrophosphatase MutT (NUDIX family)
MNKNSNITICNNCGKQGHMFHQCKMPITSYGIILFKQHNNNNIQYLMIRRKDSFGYIDFLRGKYSPYNIENIQNIVNQMSLNEKHNLLNEPFENLWLKMWDNIASNQYKSEEIASCKKFETIKNGILINDKIITLKDIIDESNTNWEETEWEFPKGRRNYQEKDLDCALREFEEETGVSKSDISIIENVLPFEESFIGTNHKSYKHKYFLAFTKKDVDFLENFQKSEVSKLEWKTLDNCLESIRPYSLEKKQLITNINKVLEEYRLYS